MSAPSPPGCIEQETAPVAILGATSHIARDFIQTAHAAYGLNFALYARRPQALADFLVANNLPRHWRIASLADFVTESSGPTPTQFRGVLNFVGVGDPAKAAAMGDAIYTATFQSDKAGLSYIRRFPDTPYIFMSSGAVYGGDFNAPATESSAAVIPINGLRPQDSYGIAKLYAEATHRTLAQNTIFDVRIFNYVSRTVDPKARYLITDMIDALRQGAIFQTTEQPLMRDYLHPADFCALMLSCLQAPAPLNMPIDAYTRAPISKSELLELFAKEFGLKYEIVPQIAVVNATGFKRNYYSENRAAAKLGYIPKFSSADGIVAEVSAMLQATA